MFSLPKPKGVMFIDAVCFLIKAPDSRLTPIQSYIFQSIMSMFGKDIEKNICSLITFADGMDPPVLAALLESGLPFGQRFTFNNSALFARNTDLSQMTLSPMFWELALLSFRNFFRHLDTLSTKSLQLTSDVLNERKRIESTVRTIEKNLEIGLLKLNTLKTEKKIFEDSSSAIKDNADFTYEVETTQQIKQDLPLGMHVLNCTHCHFTCHENFGYANDDEKINCSAMNKGYCMICPDKCFWQKHTNSNYKFIYKQVKETKTYSEMKRKYEDATGKKLTLEKVLEKLGEELDQMVDVIEDMMTTVKNCNERLNEIALCPNPLSMVQHIDLMIKNEKMQRKTGYMDRIETLQRIRKRAEISKDVDMFYKEAKLLGVKGKRQKDKRSLFQRFNDVYKFDF
ncbi:uncharacterized protein LOC127833469 [Dreissena polymorpha]|uniref:uncharacterized protein LOC127833469 n=1 Tax=Dreissena polymorpha TaxID=45954 RepID=UPI002264D295|nr:uncharacterized protein LOC127833469 [Dreissena polymorpha]